jgi:hypothetical protein
LGVRRAEQVREADCAEADAAVAQEPAPRKELWRNATMKMRLAVHGGGCGIEDSGVREEEGVHFSL